VQHGGPLRIVAPGFPGAAWQKWLSRIRVRDREHDGARMTGLDYRLPVRPVRPGDRFDPADFAVIERLGPRALATSHPAGAVVEAGGEVALGGWAWGHGRDIAAVDVSLDGGASWEGAKLGVQDGPWAWRRFEALIVAPKGPFEALLRATLADGETQPLEPVWNPKGYANNACQRLALVGA
jgi:sulfite oxidase